ncbi:hypothetical protein [Pseudomonas sp. HAR-UPW-AIA-41]|uniref:hypothetical protein n=1 Tax=Pseudomonas sp. HAR-UPW-AIA-41 TaxID=1985301 RepID=UPI0011417607|nr:hypothetical protein [Pseudomonas sp. HAR-UPW-AIA-41]
MRWETLIKVVWLVIFVLIALLAGCVFFEYKGSAWVYLLFTGLSTVLLFLGFGRGAIFFDAFIGVLLWIGFWLKFSVQTAFFEGRFNIAVGGFDGGPESLDKALLVVCCALAAVLLVRLVRERCGFCYPPVLPQIGYVGLFVFYRRFRGWVLWVFIVGVLLVCAANAWFGFYQRGQIARLTLPMGLNGIFTWLLTFGMASVSAVLLRFEFEINRGRYWVVITLALLEAAFSSISLWSRGMILNGSALLYGSVAQFRRSGSMVPLKVSIYAAILFCGLFAFSVYTVNYLRALDFHRLSEQQQQQQQQQQVNRLLVEQTSTLFLDRWVGIEGVMSVVGAESLGFELFKEALTEKFSADENSFYDRSFVASPYDNSRDDGLHFVSLPGYIAFLFYPGSYLFLFCAVLLFSILAALVEFLVYRLGGRNLVFCALIAQVIAFRYTSFGYVPAQSYLLFGSILLNVLILFFSDRLMRFFHRH